MNKLVNAQGITKQSLDSWEKQENYKLYTNSYLSFEHHPNHPPFPLKNKQNLFLIAQEKKQDGVGLGGVKEMSKKKLRTIF